MGFGELCLIVACVFSRFLSALFVHLMGFYCGSVRLIRFDYDLTRLCLCFLLLWFIVY